jgi:sigma-B regulation protein RsbU (phosphoserine phosphatase)
MDDLSLSPVRDQLLDRRLRLEREIGRSGPHADLTHLLHEVDAALARVSAGTYGFCETCHDAIESERLLADPLVRFCLDHLPASEQRALERDLQLAADIQQALLPPPRVEHHGWQLAYHYRPSRIVSGDYCDHVALGGGDFYFMVGDVTGKGVAASMLMAHLHAMFRALVPAGLPLDALMARASRAFCESTLPTHYATLVCGHATAAGDVAICNAGHPPPLLVRQSRIERIESTGLPLGLFSSEQFGVSQVHLEPGDALLVCTDGVLEAENAVGLPYGAERMALIAARSRDGGSAALVDACIDDLAAFAGRTSYQDDVTVMAVRRTATV